MNRVDLLLALLLAGANLWLNWRLALPGISPYRGSIERGYAYMARFLAAHPDPWGWNPLQYCGLPAQFMYLPLLPYWNALWFRLMPGIEATHIHRLTCALALCFGVVTVFIFVRVLNGSRRAAFFSAVAVSLLSPLYMLIPAIGQDRGFLAVPWRIQVLIKYGEGPHTVGLMLMPVALVAVYRCAVAKTFASLFLAAISLAVVVLVNWIAGLALAILVILLLAVYSADRNFRTIRVLQAGALGYLLACFWLTPTFILRMAGNWPKDAFGYQLRERELMASLALLVVLAVAWLVVRRLDARHRYLAFVALATLSFGAMVLGFYRAGINIIPESRRYALEFELFLILLAVELFRRAFQWKPWLAGAALLIVLLNRTPEIVRFVSHRYEAWQPPSRESTPEYRVASFLDSLNPLGRVFLTGGSRFRVNSWFDIQQTGGVFETGLRNRVPVGMAYQIRTGLGVPPERELPIGLDLLAAMAVEYVVVHGPESEEFYRDFRNPAKFEGALERVYDERGDRIYRMPEFRFAHLLKRSEFPGDPFATGNFAVIERYASAIRATDRPKLEMTWLGNSAMSIRGAVPEGYLVAAAVNYDDGWQAKQDGARIDIYPSDLGFLLLEPKPSSTAEIELRFHSTIGQKFFGALSAATWIFSLTLWLRERRRQRGAHV